MTILDEKVNGKIDYISPISDPETKTFEIVVKVENKDLRYKDGLSSIISIVKGNVLAHKISPSILALGNSGELGVKVIGSDNTVQFKKINVIEDTSVSRGLGDVYKRQLRIRNRRNVVNFAINFFIKDCHLNFIF